MTAIFRGRGAAESALKDLIMNESLFLVLILTQVASTFYMLGLIWIVQIVHYPLFECVGGSGYATYEQRHTRLMTWVVAPPMLLEGITALLLLWFQPAGLASWFLWIGLLLLCVIWLSTALIQVPCHQILLQGFDIATHRRLVSTNWIRTGCWTLRALIVIGIASNALMLSAGKMNMAKLSVGDAAPEFSATTSDGTRINLSDYRGQRGVVLFFYPMDGTSVCTKEACAFRDSYEKFADAGVEVIGVSSDTDESHRSFAQQNKLSFPLISDSDGSLQKAFGVSKTFGLVPGRVTYVIDKFGIIRLIYSALLASDEHVHQALAAVGQGQ